MLELSNYYIHATGGYLGEKNNKDRIIKILKDGKIKPNGFDGYDATPIGEICLCDPIIYSKKDKEDYRDFSFESFVLYSPSILVSKNLNVVIDDEDHADEVRYIGDIPIEQFECIAFPIFDQRSFLRRNEFSIITDLKIFKDNISIIEKEFSTLPIKDITTGENLTEEMIATQIEIHQKKYEKEMNKYPKSFTRLFNI